MKFMQQIITADGPHSDVAHLLRNGFLHISRWWAASVLEVKMVVEAGARMPQGAGIGLEWRQ